MRAMAERIDHPAQFRLRLLYFWQTTGILSMTKKSWPLARLANTIIIINLGAISFKHDLILPFDMKMGLTHIGATVHVCD